jgi:membrane dipeptidase
MLGRVTDAPNAPHRHGNGLDISREAMALYLESDVIDLHVDSFIWHRVFGYNLRTRHGRGILGGLCYSQVDIPRLVAAGVRGATWVITTNPARDERDRDQAFADNLRSLVSILEEAPEVSICRTSSDYFDAKRRGLHAAYIGVQGGNALNRCVSRSGKLFDGLLLRVTLVHLSSSKIGDTSAPSRLHSDRGLSTFGKRFVERLNEERIFVDLAHISRQGFWDAVDAHARDMPFIVSHTGLSGVHPHWRNLDDQQLRAVADSGGVVGVMYHSEFLGDPLLSGRAETVVRHMEHVVDQVGAEHVALGSDWDGAICTPQDMRTCSELPRLVEIMLQRRWTDTNIKKALGANFLRTLRDFRG